MTIGPNPALTKYEKMPELTQIVGPKADWGGCFTRAATSHAIEGQSARAVYFAIKIDQVVAATPRDKPESSWQQQGVE